MVVAKQPSQDWKVFLAITLGLQSKAFLRQLNCSEKAVSAVQKTRLPPPVTFLTTTGRYD
jgi:hypothetical protein